jgi:hypothetical protein
VMFKAESAVGHYIMADRPLSEAEWIEQRTIVEQKRLPKPEGEDGA